jgi:hypothetical protein
LPERRRDREDVKWTLRSATIATLSLQVQEGEDESIRQQLRVPHRLRKPLRWKLQRRFLPKPLQIHDPNHTACSKATSQAMRTARRMQVSTSPSQLQFPIKLN